MFFTIIFNDVVRKDSVILVLQNAAENGTLGDLKIEPGSIKEFRPDATTPTVTQTTRETSGKLIWNVFYVKRH